MFKDESIINVQRSDVYKFLLDHDAKKDWMVGYVSIEEFADGTFELKLKEGRKVNTYKGKTLENIENKKLVVESGNDDFSSYISYDLKDAGEGKTALTMESKITIHKNKVIVKVLFFVIGYAFSKYLIKKMSKSFKNACEARYNKS